MQEAPDQYVYIYIYITKKKRETRLKPFQKVINLKQGILNLFLMYPPLKKVTFYISCKV